MTPPDGITLQMAMVVDQAAREAAAWWGVAGAVMGFLVGLFIVWFFNSEFLWGPKNTGADFFIPDNSSPIEGQDAVEKTMDIILERMEDEVNINKFAQKVARLEGGKKQINIAQIKEVLSIVDKLTDGVLYKVIRFLR